MVLKVEQEILAEIKDAYHLSEYCTTEDEYSNLLLGLLTKAELMVRKANPYVPEKGTLGAFYARYKGEDLPNGKGEH